MSEHGANEEVAGPSSQPLRAAAAAVGRQVKACSACRGAKIKCKMQRGVPPCQRCQTRSIHCQIEKNTQSVLEETNRRWEAMAGEMAQLQTAVNVLLRVSDLPLLSSYSPSSRASVEQTAARSEADVGYEGADESLPPAPILTPVAIRDDSLYSPPINSLYEVTRLPSLRNPAKPTSRDGAASLDFISRGVISEAAAEAFFVRFTKRLDYFCYGITCPHSTLESLRAGSSLLTAAICTVASLHDPEGSAACKACHSEFLRLLSASMFSISHSPDDIRALIVGAYWLGNISYTLIGHAVRSAMRLNYHLAYFSVVDGSCKQDDIDKARLWYTLYIMDHHSSILYGRPALISPKEEPHQQWELFIRVLGNQEVDLRMSSQVALYHIISKVKDVFGGYSAKSVPGHCLPQLGNFFAELDRWYMTWGNRMPRNAYVGWFPRDGAVLHYHFARLHLCSYIFQGMSLESSATASTQVKDYASIAVSSATAVLENVLEREHLRTALVGMPLYFQAMITFAAVFLIKAARTNFWNLTAVDGFRVSELVQRCLKELRSQGAAEQHLVYHLSNGLEEVMAASRGLAAEAERAKIPEESAQQQAVPTMDSMFAMDTFGFLQMPMDTQDPVSLGTDDYSWPTDYEMR